MFTKKIRCSIIPNNGRRCYMRKKTINLTVKKRADLGRYCGKGVQSARLVNRAKIILACGL
jgi:hypothetical protein